MSFVFAGRVAFDPTGVAAQLAATGVCKLLGPVTDQELLELYRAAEVLGVPSEYEGFSLTPLEALACGTPIVIAANSGALSEQFAEVATVAAARTGEAWRAALRQSIERRSALVEPGLAFARRYSWDAAADATLAGLQSIIGRLRS
jgi:glycosyltransferase involved in cell wall biosynthesis